MDDSGVAAAAAATSTARRLACPPPAGTRSDGVVAEGTPSAQPLAHLFSGGARPFTGTPFAPPGGPLTRPAWRATDGGLRRVCVPAAARRNPLPLPIGTVGRR